MTVKSWPVLVVASRLDFKFTTPNLIKVAMAGADFGTDIQVTLSEIISILYHINLAIDALPSLRRLTYMEASGHLFPSLGQLRIILCKSMVFDHEYTRRHTEKSII